MPKASDIIRPDPEADAAIRKAVAGDPDAFEFTDEEFRRAKRGRPFSENPKQAVSIRLDPEIIAKLKADGPGWQTRANALLRKGLGL